MGRKIGSFMIKSEALAALLKGHFEYFELCMPYYSRFNYLQNGL